MKLIMMLNIIYVMIFSRLVYLHGGKIPTYFREKSDEVRQNSVVIPWVGVEVVLNAVEASIAENL